MSNTAAAATFAPPPASALTNAPGYDFCAKTLGHVRAVTINDWDVSGGDTRALTRFPAWKPPPNSSVSSRPRSAGKNSSDANAALRKEPSVQLVHIPVS